MPLRREFGSAECV